MELTVVSEGHGDAEKISVCQDGSRYQVPDKAAHKHTRAHTPSLLLHKKNDLLVPGWVTPMTGHPVTAYLGVVVVPDQGHLLGVEGP
jgi:hypothetical protein